MSLVRGLDFEVDCQESMELIRLKIGNLGDKPNKLYGPLVQLGERIPCKDEVISSILIWSTNMGQYSVIGITPDCKSGAFSGCRFKSYLAHQSIEKETFDSVGVWCISFVSNTQMKGWFDSNGVAVHISMVFWLTKPRPP